MTEDEIIELAAKKTVKKAPEELEPTINRQLQELLQHDSPTISPNLAAIIEKYSVPTPTSVPKLLECTPIEFMKKPLEHFKVIRDKYGYSKVISSLTYVQNITSQNEETVIKRCTDIKDFIKVS